MFQMSDSRTTSGKRIIAVFNSLGKSIRRDAGPRTIKQALLKEFPLDNPGYSSIAGDRFGRKGDGLIGRISARLPLKDLIMFHKHERLHLWEQDSTAWVNFCLFESVML